MIVDDVDPDVEATRQYARYVSIQIDGVSISNDVDADPDSVHVVTPADCVLGFDPDLLEAARCEAEYATADNLADGTTSIEPRAICDLQSAAAISQALRIDPS
jgi:hypothetical protein